MWPLQNSGVNPVYFIKSIKTCLGQEGSSLMNESKPLYPQTAMLEALVKDASFASGQ